MNFIHWHIPKSNFIDDYKLMGFFIHPFTVQILYAFPSHPEENILFIYKDQLLQLNLYVNFKISLHKLLFQRNKQMHIYMFLFVDDKAHTLTYTVMHLLCVRECLFLPLAKFRFLDVIF